MLKCEHKLFLAVVHGSVFWLGGAPQCGKLCETIMGATLSDWQCLQKGPLGAEKPGKGRFLITNGVCYLQLIHNTRPCFFTFTFHIEDPTYSRFQL